MLIAKDFRLRFFLLMVAFKKFTTALYGCISHGIDALLKGIDYCIFESFTAPSFWVDRCRYGHPLNLFQL